MFLTQAKLLKIMQKFGAARGGRMEGDFQKLERLVEILAKLNKSFAIHFSG